MSPPKDLHKEAFIVLAPTGKGTTFSVAARRIGSRQRYTIVATCQSDTLAQRLVDGLTLLHKGELALEVPAQRMLGEVREQLAREKAISVSLQANIRQLENRQREIARDLASMTDRMHKAEDTRDALQREVQKAALEKA